MRYVWPAGEFCRECIDEVSDSLRQQTTTSTRAVKDAIPATAQLEEFRKRLTKGVDATSENNDRCSSQIVELSRSKSRPDSAKCVTCGEWLGFVPYVKQHHLEDCVKIIASRVDLLVEQNTN